MRFIDNMKTCLFGVACAVNVYGKLLTLPQVYTACCWPSVTTPATLKGPVASSSLMTPTRSRSQDMLAGHWQWTGLSVDGSATGWPVHRIRRMMDKMLVTIVLMSISGSYLHYINVLHVLWDWLFVLIYILKSLQAILSTLILIIKHNHTWAIDTINVMKMTRPKHGYLDTFHFYY